MATAKELMALVEEDREQVRRHRQKSVLASAEDDTLTSVGHIAFAAEHGASAAANMHRLTLVYLRRCIVLGCVSGVLACVALLVSIGLLAGWWG